MNLFNNRNFGPMLLSEVDQPFDNKDYIYEIKFDGIRALIFVSPQSIEIKTRNGETITHLYPELESIKKIVTNKVIFDGEIVEMENGKPSFKALLKRHHLKNKLKINQASILNPVVFMAFDIIYENKNLTSYTLMERKKHLEGYADTDTFIKVKYIQKEGKKLFKTIKKLNLEGIVAKKKDSKYEISTRSTNWLKIKNIKTAEFYIGGFIEKSENHVISLLLGLYKNKELVYVGKVTLGKKKPLYETIKKATKQNVSPFINYQEDKAIYIKPEITIEVSYLSVTTKNHLRHPFIP